MKKLTLLTLLLLTYFTVSAQYNGFIISKEEYQAIKIKGVSINTFAPNGTNVTESLVQNWFGSAMDIKRNPLLDEIIGVHFIYGKNSIYLSTQDEPFEISNIDIVDATWSINIRGTDFRVGDSLSKFQQKFGSGFQLFESSYSPGELFGGFNFSTNEIDDITIRFNPSTKKVTKITYYTIP